MMNFESALRKEINRAIANLDRGTVGISRNCLWQLIRVPGHLSDSPRGTNAAYVARTAFDRIVSAAPFNTFVYDSNLIAL